jgi:hypothetical protein
MKSCPILIWAGFHPFLPDPLPSFGIPAEDISSEFPFDILKLSHHSYPTTQCYRVMGVQKEREFIRINQSHC